MEINDFDYKLPANLIAQQPPKIRGDSKLLIVNPNKNSIVDKHCINFHEYLLPNDLLIFNDTKVIKARLFGEKPSGGKVEVLIEKIIDTNKALVMIKTSKKILVGLQILISKSIYLEVTAVKKKLFQVTLYNSNFTNLLDTFGHVPLPPYIKRKDEEKDVDRYQTTYAKNAGAVAAPTAGLHFTKEDFLKFKEKKIKYNFLTLHVGSGTFQPVKTKNIDEHEMHYENFNITEQLKEQILQTKKIGGRVIAIGTTSMRALEGSYKNNEIRPGNQKTNIFITPGYNFKVVDSLFTNFHLPKSTLLMLVSAFAGYNFTKSFYAHAIKNKYRFFSYGDAIFIEQKKVKKDL
ncbi:MAG: tRNA preQ1(34) S-adenosylmethionine ribosyltransferase-isomerase QueA [Betaproteobacteria bacterium]|nr:tRNA preQ1(34) S-adenosylmethionine ribosyltransferase-isomerase QueA [Betaproteobacteria bacterium]